MRSWAIGSSAACSRFKAALRSRSRAGREGRTELVTASCLVTSEPVESLV